MSHKYRSVLVLIALGGSLLPPFPARASAQVPQLLRDIRVGTSGSQPLRGGQGFGGVVHFFADLGGTVLFAANDGPHGNELWRSDGTEAGTFMVEDISPGSASSFPLFECRRTTRSIDLYALPSGRSTE